MTGISPASSSRAQPSNAIKLSGRSFLAPHRGSCPEGLCKRTGFLGVKRRENPVRRHFERKREIFFVCGQGRLGGKRGTGNMLHATWGVRCFMQTALRRKTETGNEKDPSAALGMTKRERYISHSFSIRCGSQPPPPRGTSFRRKEGEREE